MYPGLYYACVEFTTEKYWSNLSVLYSRARIFGLKKKKNKNEQVEIFLFHGFSTKFNYSFSLMKNNSIVPIRIFSVEKFNLKPRKVATNLIFF